MLLSLKKFGVALLTVLMTSLISPSLGASCIGKKKRRSESVVRSIAWTRRSSFQDDDFLKTIQDEDVNFIPYTLDSFTLKRHREWQIPLARAYHLIAERFGIENWAGSGFVWFRAGGQEEDCAIPSHHDKTRVYKIHLMPRDDLMADFALRLGKIVQEDPELWSRIIYYKFLVRPGQPTQEHMPRVVLYLDGKENAQYVLNIVYERFKLEPGSGYAARFSAYVTDLIWVAQGDGDRKKDERFQADYEQPYLIYYKKEYSETVGDYYLKHPTTGYDLISPFMSDYTSDR